MFWLLVYLLGYIAAIIALFYGNRFFRSCDDLQAVPLSEGVALSLLSWAIVVMVLWFVLTGLVERLDDSRLGKFFLGETQ